MLAIHGLNISSSSSDFLIPPERWATFQPNQEGASVDDENASRGLNCSIMDKILLTLVPGNLIAGSIFHFLTGRF